MDRLALRRRQKRQELWEKQREHQKVRLDGLREAIKNGKPIKKPRRQAEQIQKVQKAKANFVIPQIKFHAIRDALFGNYKEELPKSPFESGRAFRKHLEKKGWKWLGGGMFSSVMWKEGSDKVLKVCNTLDPWPHYVIWANKKGYGGTFAPKIYSYKYYKGVKSPFYVAVMEKLDKCTHNLKGNHPLVMMDKLFYYTSQHSNEHAALCMDLMVPGAGKFAKDFAFEFPQDKFGYDLHGGNFMTRGDKEFVLTDPLSRIKGLRPEQDEASDNSRYAFKERFKVAA